jgi:hypothetical protein
MTDETNRPTCDLDGCETQGHARYLNVHTEEWIDTCHKHAPIGARSGGNHAKFAGRPIYFHTVKSQAYPAEKTSNVTGRWQSRRGNND